MENIFSSTLMYSTSQETDPLTLDLNTCWIVPGGGKWNSTES
jgi:hypothetical protein